jgi:hypothetical protein
MTTLDVRVQRSTRSGLIKRPEVPDSEQMPPGLDEEAVDEIVELYRKTQRSIEEYDRYPFTVRVAPCPGRCGGVVCTHGAGRHRGRLVVWCDLCAATRGTIPRRPYVEPPPPTATRCGTDAGYHRHHRQGDLPACDECKAAHTEAVKSRPSYTAARQAA